MLDFRVNLMIGLHTWRYFSLAQCFNLVILLIQANLRVFRLHIPTSCQRIVGVLQVVLPRQVHYSVMDEYCPPTFAVIFFSMECVSLIVIIRDHVIWRGYFIMRILLK